MFPELWSARDIIFCHFRSFFAVLLHCWLGNLKFGKKVKSTWRYYTFTYVHHKSRSYDVWFLRYEVQRTKLFVILGHFLPFDPPNNPKNQNFEKIKRCLEILSFYTCVPQMTIMMYGSWYIKHDRQNFLSFWVIFEKMEKAPEDTIILHKCTVNDNHMMYGSWDINCSRHIFLPALAIFCPFYPTNSPKNENVKKLITPGDIIILQKCTKTHDHRLYCFWDMVCAGCNSYFSFWVIFHHFTQVYQKSWSYANLFLRYGTLHM